MKNHIILLFARRLAWFARCLVFPALLILGGNHCRAALRLWTGGGTDARWSTAANWSPAGGPQNNDDLAFTAGMPKQTCTNDLVGLTVHSFIFSGTSNAYSLFGNQVWIMAGVNSVQSAGTATLKLNLRMGADQEFIADGAQLNFGGEVDINGNTLTLRSTTSNSLASLVGLVTGAGDIIKLGPGQALFGGSLTNSYRGTLYVTEGVMKLDKQGANGGPAVPGNLVIGDLDNFIFGYVVCMNSNQISLTATNTINHGSIDLNGFDAVLGPMRFYDGRIIVSNAFLRVNGQISQPSWPYSRVCSFLGGLVNLQSNPFDLHAPGPFYISSKILGGPIDLNGRGVLILGNTNNSFNGLITVNGGLLEVEDSQLVLGATPGITLNNDGILGLRNVTIANLPLTITSSNAGVQAIFEPCAWTGPVNLNFTGQAKFTCGDRINFSSLVISGPIHGTGGMWFGGNNTVELTGHNDFTGGIRSACTLLRLNTGAFQTFYGPLEVGGGYNYWSQFDYGEFDGGDTNANCEVRWLDTAFQFVPQAILHTNGWANLNGHDNEFGSVEFTGGRISAGGGKLYLDGPVTTHPASVSASIEGLAQLSSFPSVTFDVADGAANPDLQISAVISDGVPSGIDKEGNGELLLPSANTYRNATTVGGGVLRIQNDAALGTTGAGTTVLDGGTLYNETAVALSEPLTLTGAGRGGTNGALYLGPATGVQAGIVLSGGATVRNDISFAILSGVISGSGPFTKTGAGSLQLGGGSGSPNTYTGDTTVAQGTLVGSKGAGVTTVPGHLIIGTGTGSAAATFQNFASFTIVGSVTVNRGGLWDLAGQSEGFSVPALEGHPPLTLNGGGDVQTGAGTVYLPVGGDIVVNPGSVVLASSLISGNLGLDPGPHHFSVQSGIKFIGVDVPELDVSATVSQTSTAADLVKEGPGEMRLSSSNSFTGTATVNQGTLIAANNSALGTTAGGTIVNSNASLALDGGLDIVGESLTLNSSNAAALLSLGVVTNVWDDGPIDLQQTAGINVASLGGGLTHFGFGLFGGSPASISGPGGFTKIGPGTLFITGLQGGNTYTGQTTIAGGTLEATRAGRSLSTDILLTGSNSVLRTGRAGNLFNSVYTVLPTGASVTVESGAIWTMSPTNSETLSRLSGDGQLQTGTGGTLTVSNDVSCTFSGQVSGSGALSKRGPATFQVTSPYSYIYTGAATVFDGTYKVDGDFRSNAVAVKPSAILRGGGTLGDVTVEPGGVVQVDERYTGVRGGVLGMNSVNFQPSGSVLNLDFYGPDTTGGNDELYVNNAVTLGSVNLSASFQYPPHEGDVVTLITKTTAGAVSGAISNFPSGSLQMIGQIPVLVSYVGGDGNDVTLTVTNLPLGGGGTQVVSGNNGNALTPGDCGQLWLTVTNRSGNPITRLHGTLRSLTEGLTVTIGDSDYPDLLAGATGTNMIPFQVRTDPAFPCGGGAQFELELTASNLPATALVYTLPGATGYALDFDGINDEVDVAANAFSSVVNNFTIELWANPEGNRTETAETNNGVSGVSAALHQAQRFAVFPDRGNFAYGLTHVGAGLSIGRNGISAYEQGTNYLPSRLVYSNALSGWTHVALVYASRQPKLYVNGVLARSGAAGPFTSIHPSASLGGSTQGAYGNFNGQLDEVRIWNVALSQSQIQSNMVQSLTGTEPGLVVYYRCDEAGGSVLNDSAAASPNPAGTLANGAAFVLSDRPGACGTGAGECESCWTLSGTFTTNTPTLTTPLSPDGPPSICAPPKLCPGPFPLPLPPTPYQVYHFTNTSVAEACVTAQLRFDCPGAPDVAMHAAAYLGSFDPNDPCLNYLGDSAGYGTTAFSFPVPAGSSFAIVVSLWVQGIGCDNYTLELFGLPCPPPVLAIEPAVEPEKVRVHWSTAYPGWQLQSASNLLAPPPLFQPESIPAVIAGGRFNVTNDATGTNRFYRLVFP